MEIAFIDSCCIADWIIARLAKKNKSEEEGITLIENIKSVSPQAFYSYILIEAIRLKGIKNYKIYTSSLAIAETTSVIFETYIIEEMAKRKIPLRYFYKYRDRIRIPKEILKQISNEIIYFFQFY